MREPDLIEMMDGAADVSVVNTGLMLSCGVCDEHLLEEVDRSNLDKFSGDYTIRDDGKLIKPSDWRPPDVEGVLLRQGLEE